MSRRPTKWKKAAKEKSFIASAIGKGFSHSRDLRHQQSHRNRPDAIRAFIKGWFETIGFMRKNKANSVDVAKDIMETDTAIAGRVYDELMPMFSDDGKFDPKALAVFSRSYVELQMLDKEPDMTKLFTESFLPKK